MHVAQLMNKSKHNKTLLCVKSCLYTEANDNDFIIITCLKIVHLVCTVLVFVLKNECKKSYK